MATRSEPVTIALQRPTIIRLVLVWASVIIIVAGTKAASELLNQFFLAMFLLLISLPIWQWLRQKGVALWLANVLVIAGVVVSVIALLTFMGLSVTRLIAQVPEYQQGLVEQQSQIDAFLRRMGFEPLNILALEQFSPARIFGVVVDVLASIVPAIADLVFTLFIFAFALLEADTFAHRLRTGLRPGNTTMRRLSDFSRSVSDFIRIKAVLGALAATGDVILFLALGVDFPLLWGLLSFFASFIPYIGYWIALVPPLLLAFLESGWQAALLVFLGFQFINGVADNVVGPRFLGEGLNLSAVVTLLVVIFWSWVLGPIGALLALPLTVALKVLVLGHYTDTRWLDSIMSSSSMKHAPRVEGSDAPAGQ